MLKKEDKSIYLEGVQILWPNFSGAAKKFNAEGERNFNVLIDPADADKFVADNWNVKMTKERELDDGEMVGNEPYIPVKVAYGRGRPPTVVLITQKEDGSMKRTNLDETTVQLLDWVKPTNVDVKIRPHDWDVEGKTGRKGYLAAIYVTTILDRFEDKYADIPLTPTVPLLDEEDEG